MLPKPPGKLQGIQAREMAPQGQQIMVRESDLGAYLGPAPGLTALVNRTASDPHFDVFDGCGQRLILAKCSRLPDDENVAAGRYGIDFHRAMPSFDGASEVTCDWGEGPITVNACNYARYLPQALRFREFTANLAFAAGTRQEYRAKRHVYQHFYHYLYHTDVQMVFAAPHSGEVRRAPDDFHPFPQSEIDAWVARVAVRCLRPTRAGRKRILVSLHSSDYFGVFLDVGDFGLPQNQLLSRAVAELQADFRKSLAALVPAYRQQIVPYTRSRLHWIEQRWGDFEPQHLLSVSTAARSEVLNLVKILGDCLDSANGVTYQALLKGLDTYWASPGRPLITLNRVFSGRKTARLLHLADQLHRAGIDTAVQIECSRFLARHDPDLAAALIIALLEKVAAQ